MVTISRPLALSTWLLLAGPGLCGKMAAWWANDMGPQLMAQDDETGDFVYSACNSPDQQPVWPEGASRPRLHLTSHPPKANTSVAGAGWTSGSAVYASIFYQDASDDVVNSLLQCDTATGQWQDNGDYVITSGDSPKPAADSGLAVILLGAEDGYRVFYNDLAGSVHAAVAYTADTKKWLYQGPVSRDKTSANVIGACFPGDTNITVVTPRDDANMEFSRFYGDNTFHITTSPTPLTLQDADASNKTEKSAFKYNTAASPSYKLPGWNGSPQAIAMSEDSSWARSAWYVGTDNNLKQVKDINYKWTLQDPQDESAWPRADDGMLAVASDFKSNSLRIYYRSGGKMTEVNGDGGMWAEAVALPSVAPSSTASPSSPSSTSAADSDDDDDSGLSPGAKAGVGVGVTLGVLAFGGLLVAFLLMRRRQRRIDDQHRAMASMAGPGGFDPSNPGGGAAAFTPGSVHNHNNSSNNAYSPGASTTSPDYAHQVYPHQHGLGFAQPGYAPGDVYGQQGAYAPPPPAGDFAGVMGPGGQQWPMYGQPQQHHHQVPVPPMNASPENNAAALPHKVEVHEMPEQAKPVEMMGEGHYQEMDTSGGKHQ